MVSNQTCPINVCVIGGGNIGTLLLGDLGAREDVKVMLYTPQIERWSNTVSIYDYDGNLEKTGNIARISNNPRDVISNSDIIFITVPSNALPKLMSEIEEFIQPNTWVGIMPGSGGVEFYKASLLEKECILFGFQRVYGISRVKEYGNSVYNLGKKNELHISAIPHKNTAHICDTMERLLSIPCKALPNYLSITLTPSNPILHTTRLYSLFSDYKEGIYWTSQINFYSDWTDDSSSILLACDAELQHLLKKLEALDLTFIKPLTEHYESVTVESMTRKIKSIPAFKEIKAPMIKVEGGYIPDFNSRYFTEDFPYGLCIIKSFCTIAEIDTPNIDKVLRWFERMFGLSYFENGQFNGQDLKDLPLPQNFGVDTIEKIISFYS